MNVTIQDERNQSVTFGKIENKDTFYFDYIDKYFLCVKVSDNQAYCFCEGNLFNMRQDDVVYPVTVELTIKVK